MIALDSHTLILAMRDALETAWTERLGAVVARERANNATAALSYDDHDSLVSTLRSALEAARFGRYGGLDLTEDDVNALTQAGAVAIAEECVSQIQSAKWRAELYDALAMMP